MNFEPVRISNLEMKMDEIPFERFERTRLKRRPLANEHGPNSKKNPLKEKRAYHSETSNLLIIFSLQKNIFPCSFETLS